MNEQTEPRDERQLQQRDPDETWSVPVDDLDATWPIGDHPDLDHVD